MLLQAIIYINLALFFYTWAVFSARRRGLHQKHLLFFGVGLGCDYLGTDLLLRYGLASGVVPEWHIVVGVASLAGMAFHFMLAFAASMVRRAEAGESSLPSSESDHLHQLAYRLLQRDSGRDCREVMWGGVGMLLRSDQANLP